MTAARGKRREPSTRPTQAESESQRPAVAPHLPYSETLASLADLPFIAWRDNEAKDYWAALPTGGYAGGNVTGKAMARMLLRIFRGRSGSLSQVVFVSMLRSLIQHASGVPMGPAADRDEVAMALNGQFIGFVAELSRFLSAAASGEAGRVVDYWDDHDLRELFRAGQFFDQAAYMAELARRDRENGIEDDEPPRARRRVRKASAASAAKV